MQPRYRTALTWVFFVGLAALLLAIVVGALPSVLPALVAGRISRNSEGVLLALLLAGWIQFARPVLTGRRHEWPVTLAVAIVLLVVGVFLFATQLTNSVKTLNESFLAAAVLVPYLQLPRPLPRWVPLGMSLTWLAVILVGHSTDVVTLTAEALGGLLLAPIAFDVVDRGILDSTARTVLWQRLAWYAFLIAGPLVFFDTANGSRLGGELGEILLYAGRTAEIFFCLLAVELYFAVGLGRTGRARAHSDHAAPISASPTQDPRVG